MILMGVNDLLDIERYCSMSIIASGPPVSCKVVMSRNRQYVCFETLHISPPEVVVKGHILT